MHFLEPAWFLNAPDLAGRKVNVLYAPLWVFTPRCGCLHPAVGVWALKQPLCSHYKWTSIFIWSLPIYFFGPKQLSLSLSCFRAQKSLDFPGPTLPMARVMSLPRIKIIMARAIYVINRFINSYNWRHKRDCRTRLLMSFLAWLAWNRYIYRL